MRRLLALIRREWRQARALTIASAAIAVGLSVAANEIYFEYRHAAPIALFAVPALVTLYLLALSADLVAGDTATGRVATDALLPARPLAVWTAKVVFLALAGSAFVVWVVLVQLALLGGFGSPEAVDLFLRNLPDAWLPLAAAGAIASAVLFFSTLLTRGFAAVLAGLLCVGGVGFGLSRVPWAAMDVRFGPVAIGVVAAVLGVAFLAGSATAYTVGRIHLGSRFRRAALGGGVTLLLLLAPAAAGAGALASWLRIEPGDPDVGIGHIAPSPDGKHLALVVGKGMQKQCRVWILRISDGRISTVPGRFVRLGQGWQADGTLHVIRSRLDGRKLVIDRQHWVDPETGELVKTRGVEPAVRVVSDGTWEGLRKEGSGWRRTVDWTERGIHREFDAWVRLTGVPGRVLEWRKGKPGRLILHDLETATETTIVGGTRCHSLSPDGLRLALARSVLDLATGRTLAGPWDRDRYGFWPAADGRTLLLYGDRGSVLDVHDLDAGSMVSLEARCGYPTSAVRILPDRRIVVVRPDSTIDLLSPAGEVLRRLYGPR